MKLYIEIIREQNRLLDLAAKAIDTLIKERNALRNPKVGICKEFCEIDVTALSERIGRSRSWTSQVLHGHEKSEATRKLIAEALGMKVEDLWPNNKHGKKAA